MTTHAAARQIVRAAWARVFGADPSLREAQAAQAIALLETSYGTTWQGEGQGSNNWGAVQASRPPCGEGSFGAGDKHADGTTYSVCFRRYNTPEDGAADMIRIAFTAPARAAAAKGDLRGLARAMHAAGYYEGTGATQTERIEGYHHALRASVERIAAALGEAPPPRARASKASGLFALGLGVLGIGLAIAARK